jgi:hypothetical protein
MIHLSRTRDHDNPARKIYESEEAVGSQISTKVPQRGVFRLKILYPHHAELPHRLLVYFIMRIYRSKQVARQERCGKDFPIADLPRLLDSHGRLEWPSRSHQVSSHCVPPSEVVGFNKSLICMLFR